MCMFPCVCCLRKIREILRFAPVQPVQMSLVQRPAEALRPERVAHARAAPPRAPAAPAQAPRALPQAPAAPAEALAQAAPLRQQPAQEVGPADQRVGPRACPPVERQPAAQSKKGKKAWEYIGYK